VTPQELRERTWQFHRRIKRFCAPLIRHVEHADQARQLRRAAASTASNYRAVCIARTDRSRIAKLDIVLEEADETVFWSMDLEDSGLGSPELAWIRDEAEQLTRIFTASRETLRRRLAQEPNG
jgi:four helix bundle protein